MSLALMLHWVANFALGQFFLSVVASVGVARVYVFFAAVALLGAFWISNTLVETKGKSPEEIFKLMQ